MDTDKIIRNIVRKGVVSSVNPANGTARVIFQEKDNDISAEYHLLNRGSGKLKDYWIPDINDQVVCLCEANDKNFSSGWILGSWFSDEAAPQVQNAEIRRVDFGDGSFIEYNRESHSMTINCTGDIYIKGANIYLN